MIKKYSWALLLLSILIPSLQAEQPKTLVEIELAERARLGIVDDIIAFAAGGAGVGVAGLVTGALAFYMTRDRLTCALVGLGGVALYGAVSCKMAMGEGHLKKMFGRGGAVATTALLLMLIPGAIEVYFDPRR